MPIIPYIKIREFCSFHNTQHIIIQEFSDLGLIEIVELENEPCIHTNDLERLETMLRLHDDLGINSAGIETILYMREKMSRLQQRMKELERRVKQYEHLVM